MKNTLFVFITLIIVLFAPSCKVHKCVEKIDPNCICTLQYDPVCGCNNKTYGNACAAQCAGIKHYKKGECPK